jgi:hypothetical protein
MNDAVDNTDAGALDNVPVNGAAENWFGDEYAPVIEQKGWKAPDDALKSYTELEKLMSQSVRMLSPDASEEDRQAQIDRFREHYPEALPAPPPADPSGYAYEPPEGYTSTPEDDQFFSELAHKSGLTVDQAKSVHAGLAERAHTQELEAKANYETKLNALRAEWPGETFERNLQLGSQMLKSFEKSMPGLTEELVNNGLAESPVMMKWMHNIAMRMGEKPMQEPGQFSGALTPAEASAKIEESQPWNNPNHPANNPMHPQHREALAERDRWYDIVAGRG